MGLAGRAPRSAGAAFGRAPRMGCRRTRCTRWRTARSHLGRRAARAAGGCAAPSGAWAISPAACPDMGRRACGRSPAASSATTTAGARRCRAGAACCAASADVGISRACSRCARTGLESPRCAIVGCRSTGAVRAACSRLGRARGICSTGHAAGAFME
jgi:hypothetical protein